MLVVLTVFYTLFARRRGEDTGTRDGATWKRAYHLACEIASGRTDLNDDALVELLDSTESPTIAAAAAAVAIRQHADDVDPAFWDTISRSKLPDSVRSFLRSEDTADQIEALELVEVLRMHDLLGEAAVLARSDDSTVVRAACDAVVEIEPSIGIGILVGLADSGESWVVDGLGRAADVLSRTENGNMPLSRGQWRHAPVLARRALMESATFDRLTVNDAIATLVESLESPSSSKRFAAVSALASCAENPGAQIALAGALGAEDRMTRFASAASLADSVAGRKILEHAAARQDGSDAAVMAAELLWSQSPIDGPFTPTIVA